MWNISIFFNNPYFYVFKFWNLLLLTWLSYFNYINNNYINNNYINNNYINNNYINNNYILSKKHIYKPKKLFNLLLKLTNQSTQLIFKIHPTQQINYIYNSKFNVYTINLVKFIKFWLNLYKLLYHIFFFKIPIFIFNTPYFKYENLSFNWKLTKIFHSYWKYIELTFFWSKNNKLNQFFCIIFLLIKKDIYIIFFLNTLLHKNTLLFLHKYKFYSVGFIPLNISLYNVNFAIPTSNDNIFTELFFIRFILQIKIYINWTNIQFLKKVWFKYLL